jgi:hypothetical protein
MGTGQTLWGSEMIRVGEAKAIGCRLYRNPGDRRRAVAQLKQEGYNYFTGFRDTHVTHPVGLSFGKAEWCSLFPYEKDI